MRAAVVILSVLVLVLAAALWWTHRGASADVEHHRQRAQEHRETAERYRLEAVAHERQAGRWMAEADRRAAERAEAEERAARLDLELARQHRTAQAAEGRADSLVAVFHVTGAPQDCVRALGACREAQEELRGALDVAADLVAARAEESHRAAQEIGSLRSAYAELGEALSAERLSAAGFRAAYLEQSLATDAAVQQARRRAWQHRMEGAAVVAVLVGGAVVYLVATQ